MDLCLSLSAPWPPALLGALRVLTGEPPTFTKALVLPTDFFAGGFPPAEVDGPPGLVWPEESEQTGEWRFLNGDTEAEGFLAAEGVVTTGTGAERDVEEDEEV